MTIAFTPEHDRQIKSFAWKVVRRAHAAGAASLTLADVYQELCIAWCKARDSWREEFGVPFGAYFRRGMQHHVNRWVAGEIEDGQPASLDRKVEDGEADLYEVIASKSVGPEDLLLSQDYKEHVMARLSPRARLFVQLLDSPPKFLLDAVRQYREHANFAASIQRSFAAPRGVTTTMVMDFMEANNAERSVLYSELAKVSGRSIKESNK